MLLLVEDLANNFSSLSELIDLLCPPMKKVKSSVPPTKQVPIISTIKTRTATIPTIYCLPRDIIRDKVVKAYLSVQPVVHANVTVLGASSHDGRYPMSSTLVDNNEETTTWWLSADGTMPLGTGAEYIEYDLISSQSTTIEPSTTTNAMSFEPEERQKHTINLDTFEIKDDDEKRSLCRLTKISIKIPTMPYGPLSVAFFHLERQKNDPSPKKFVKQSSRNENDTKDDDKKKVYSSSWIKCTQTFHVAPSVGVWQEFELDEPLDVRVVRLVCTANQISTMLSDEALRKYAELYSVGFFSVRFD